MRDLNFQGSVISLSAGIHMLQKMCTETGGEFMLSKNQTHFMDLLKVILLFLTLIEESCT
jgi:hypothetical protein